MRLGPGLPNAGRRGLHGPVPHAAQPEGTFPSIGFTFTDTSTWTCTPPRARLARSTRTWG
jgi:hypothetical protein